MNCLRHLVGLGDGGLIAADPAAMVEAIDRMRRGANLLMLGGRAL